MLKTLFVLLLSIICVSCEQKSTEEMPASAAAAPGPEMTAPPQPAAPSQPPLVIKEGQLIEVGEIYTNALLSYTFTISNTSDADLQLDMVSGTCNCIIIENNLSDYVLPAGQEVTFGLKLNAAKIPVGDFVRDALVEVKDYLPVKIVLQGNVKPLLIVPPPPQVNFGLLKDCGEKWSRTVAIELQPEVPGELEIPTELSHPLFTVKSQKLSDRKTEITVEPKGDLPYTQEFIQKISVPVLQPAGCPKVELIVSGQVGGKIFFMPQAYNFTPKTLAESSQHTVSFYLGEVKLPDGSIFDASASSNKKNRFARVRRSRIAAPAVPVNYNLKETLDWDSFFANLEVDVPRGVQLEKIKHESGVELKVTISSTVFARARKILQIRPRRGTQYFNNLLLTALKVQDDDDEQDTDNEEQAQD